MCCPDTAYTTSLQAQGYVLASFPGLHAQLLSLFVLQATKDEHGGLGTRLGMCTEGYRSAVAIVYSNK